MGFRSRVRSSGALGILLTRRCSWYLRRRRRLPGMPGRYRRSLIGYRLRPADKKRVRRQYDIRERQLRSALGEAVRRGGDPGETGENLVELLEQRLDALVWRAGFAPTIHQARRLVGHNDLTVDGSKVNRPSYRLRPGQTFQVRESRRDRPPFALAAAKQADQAPPPYLDVHPGQLRATLTREPRRDEVPVLGEERLVVQSY